MSCESIAGADTTCWCAGGPEPELTGKAQDNVMTYR